MKTMSLSEAKQHEIEATIRALASGRLATYSPESEVAVPREELEGLLAAANHAGEVNTFTHKGVTWLVKKLVSGWLVSTKQEVSE